MSYTMWSLCFIYIPYVQYYCPLNCSYYSLDILLLSDTKIFSRSYTLNLSFLQEV